jgi:hypothetical protein
MPSPDDGWHIVRQLHRCELQAGELTPRPPHGAASGLTLKFGGSLLVRSDWARFLRSLLDASVEPVQILVGGGPIVNGLRRLDSTFAQPAERMHRLAIRAMGVTALMVAEELGLPMCGEPTPSAGLSMAASITYLPAGKSQVTHLLLPLRSLPNSHFYLPKVCHRPVPGSGFR